MRTWLRIALLMLMALGMFSTPAPAQNNEPVTTQSQRQRRLREHEKKIQEIISERRAEREKREAEEKARQQANPPEQKGEGPAEPAKETPKPASSVVMGFKFVTLDGVSDYNNIVNQGDTFVSEVMLFNIDQNPIDRIRLALRYDRRFIEPVRIFDTSLAGMIDGAPKFSINDRDSIINYDVKLSRPLAAPESTPLRILWKALRPTPFTGIDFKFSPLEKPEDEHTAIYVRDVNILGIRDDVEDGVLSGGLMIEVPKGTQKTLQGKEEELKDIYLGSVASDSKVGLVLTAPKGRLEVGDDFIVKVKLNNPEGTLVDAINFFVLFDPRVLRVIDEDKFNYIVNGVNVHEGPYHHNFPWDMHVLNDVSNERGQIQFAMSLSNGNTLPSRTIADIHFKAIAPAETTEVAFVKGRPGAPKLTSVRYFGFESLDLASAQLSHPAVSFSIANSPNMIAQGSSNAVRPLPAPTPVAATGPTSSIKPLKIER
jgi:hypothetical protein